MSNFHDQSLRVGEEIPHSDLRVPAGNQPYYDPVRGFVYIQADEISRNAPDAGNVAYAGDDDANLDEIEKVRPCTDE